jgi:pSer/pThr/pTyr-binding forkhead associated (FHA) protein
MDPRHDVSSASETRHPPLLVEGETTRLSVPTDQTATIGRDASCTLHVDSGLVSRLHAQVRYHEGQWLLEDAGSTNGVFVDGERVDRVTIDGPRTIALGANGPRLTLRPETADPSGRSSPTDRDGAADEEATRPASEDGAQDKPRAPESAASPTEASPNRRSSPPPMHEGATDDRASAARRSGGDRPPPRRSGPRRSVTAYFDYYFGERGETEEAGEHTRLLRQAYQRARHGERRRYLFAVVGVLGVALVLAVVALWQYQERDRLEGLAEQVFLDLKRQDLALAQLRLSIEADEPIADQLAQRETERRMLAQRYSGYVRELGLHRRLSAEEQLIHTVARIFGESEFSMPAGFVREVRETIHEYWLGPGRARFEQAVRRAQANGYVEPIVHQMMQRGLPPEFFYLALQESDFRTEAVGPPTRWGIAKGMWQFIPTTGRMYDLAPGPRAGDPVVDPMDDRHDFQRSTDAAARYLQTIYTTDAQASGLLVIASYNWGEHRVNRKLTRMADAPSNPPAPSTGIPDAVLAGIPEDPGERTYWRFLTEYRDRMPEETRTYVLRVFAAAVIGQEPRQFGFDFDNPLQDAIESFAPSAPVAPPPPPSTDS